MSLRRSSQSLFRQDWHGKVESGWSQKFTKDSPILMINFFFFFLDCVVEFELALFLKVKFPCDGRSEVWIFAIVLRIGL